MKGSFHFLLVSLCCSSFALRVLGEDSDFIDEKGKALRNLKGKRNSNFDSCPSYLVSRLTHKRKHKLCQ